MCQCGCPNEDSRTGDCRARKIDGLLPCEIGYEDAKAEDDYERDRAAEQRAEARRENDGR